MLFKNKTSKILISSFLAIILLLAALWGVFLFIGYKISDINFIKKNVYKNYGLELDANNIKTKFTGLSYKISSDYFSLSEHEKTPFVYLNKPFVRVNIFPLLIGKLSVSEFNSNDVVISITRLKDGTFDFAKFYKPKKSFIKLDLSKVKVKLPCYLVNINDLLTNSKFSIDGYALNSFGLDFNKKFKLNTQGRLIVSNSSVEKVSPYLIDVDFLKTKKGASLKKHEIIISNFDLSFLKSYFDKFGFSAFDAVVDIYSTRADKNSFKLYTYLNKINVAFDYKGDLNTIRSKAPLINKLDFTFSNKDLIIENGSFFADGVDISYFGKIKNIFKPKDINLDLKVKLADVSLQKLLQITPDTLLPLQEPYVKYMKEYNLNSIVNGEGDVIFKGKNDYKVFGKLDFADVYVVRRPKNAKTSFGSCVFKGRDVLIDVFANAPNNAMLTVFGKTKIGKKPVGEFQINSIGKLDLAFAQEILLPVQKILALKLGPIPYMTLKGTGAIDLHTMGTKEQSSLRGQFETSDATVTLDGLNAVLTNGQVKVLFKDTDIIFKGAKGKIGAAPVQIDGVSNTNGDLNIDVNVKDIPAKIAMNIAQTSPIVTSSLDGGEFLKSFIPLKGGLDFYLNISGNVPPDAVFGQQSDTVFVKGKIDFKGVDLIVAPKIQGKNLKGVLNFKNDADFNLTADIFNSPFKIIGKVAQKGAKNKVLHGVPSFLSIKFTSNKILSSSVGNFILDNIELFAPQNRLFAVNLAKIFNTNAFLMNGDVSAGGLVYSNATSLDLSGFDFDGQINGINSQNSSFVFKGGNISLKGKNAKFNKLHVLGSGIDFLIDGTVDKFASIQPLNNLNLTFKNSSVFSYISLISKILPKKAEKALQGFGSYKGYVSGNVKLYKDKIDGEFIPINVSFLDKKTGKTVSLKDGKIKLKNDKTYLKAFNMLYGELPLYFDGFMQTDGRVNPEFNFLFSTNLSETSCDKLINPYLKYPLNITNEVFLKGRIMGKLNAYTLFLNTVVDKGADVSFMGLKLGDIDNKREASAKIKFAGNHANIGYVRYYKLIPSQSGKLTPYDLLKMSGDVTIQGGNFILHNLSLVTPNPAPVRFLNVLFKKSIIKDGLFTSNLVLNGPATDVKAVGSLMFSNVFVPMYNSFIDNIKIDLGKTEGRATFSLSAFDTSGNFVIDFANKMNLPIVINNFSAHSESVSIDNLMNAFAVFADSASKAAKSSIEANENMQVFLPSDIMIKKGSINVDKLFFNGVEANNLKVNFSHSKDTSLKIDSAYLAMAGGLIKGSGIYKFDTKDVSVNSDFINCDVNVLTKAFFNISGEIYGNANGKFSLSMKDFTPSDYVQKINAGAEFEILNGAMPKLGSIEYLLRASNFFKSGIFGLTINNVIELLTPYKHGDFNKISGTLKVKNAQISDLKIYSQGDNLSTYTYGTYDIPSAMSQIEILGKLSKKVSNLLGPIGNASVASILNSVTKNKVDALVKGELLKGVNKIPLIELNNDEYRLFNVKIQGDPTKDNIVKSFTWLN